MSINLNRFNAQQISPLEDVRLFSRVFTVNGILQGCVLTHLGGNQVRITSGVGIIGGGDFEVVQEDLLVALSSSGTVPGRIYIRINLSDTVTPIKIMSVAANPLPALTQTANFYETNGIWEMELATYSATTTAISGLTTKYISITDVFDNYLKKSLVANTQAEVNAVTVDGVPCGTKPVKELITSLNDFKTYSTTEKVVGTWINGKPLYRKTVQVTAQNQSIGSNIGVCMIDNSHSFVRVDAINQYLPIHYYTPNGAISWFIICNNGVFTSEGSRVPFSYAGYTTYITVEYTKTTD